MKNEFTEIKIQIKFTLSIILLSLFIINPAAAYDFSSNVLNFQLKLAKKGDANAQYNLGIMYETGRGVEKNLDEALKWHLKSSKKNNKSAKRRITYIDILKNGFNKSKHMPWLQELTQDAKYKDGDASLLLGILYKEGVIVKQDLEKSLVLLKQAVVKNISSAEDELESVKVLMEEEKKLALLKQQQAEQKQKAIADAERKKRQLEISRIKNNKIQKQKQKEQAAKNKARYEKKRSVNKAALVSTRQVDRPVEKTKPIEIKHQPSWAEAVELQRLKEEAGND